jgi:uncharacterized protein YkwD
MIALSCFALAVAWPLPLLEQFAGVQVACMLLQSQEHATQAAQSRVDVRAEFFRRINELRAKDEVPALVRSDKLDAAAQKHAANMANQDKVGDDDKNPHVLDGKSPRQRAEAEGYQGRSIGENLGMVFGVDSGQKGLDIAIPGWVKSEPHYKNIMNPSFEESGVGLAQSKSGKWYYCQVFGTPK